MNLIARYHEIALKGRNRPFFVEKLADNLRRALSDLPGVTVQPFSARIGVHVPDEVPWETVQERVGSRRRISSCLPCGQWARTIASSTSLHPSFSFIACPLQSKATSGLVATPSCQTM